MQNLIDFLWFVGYVSGGYAAVLIIADFNPYSLIPQRLLERRRNG